MLSPAHRARADRVHLIASAALTALLALTAAASGQAGQGGGAQHDGAVIQSIPPPVTQNPKLPPLHLSDTQRDRVRSILAGKNTEVDFALKSAKPAQSFAPSVGAKVPAGLHPHALPPPLIYEMPPLKRYSYLKFKGQVLIIDPMSRKIVDMFAEASG
jgi:hypothetical protein